MIRHVVQLTHPPLSLALLEVVHSNRGVIGDGGVVNKTKSVKQVPNKKKDARIGGHSGDGRGASVLRLQRRADTASQILTRMASEDPQRRQSRLTGWVLGRPAFSYGGSTESQQSPLAAASQAAKPLVLPELGPDRALYQVVLAVFTVASVDHSIHPPPSSDPKNSASSKLLLPSPPPLSLLVPPFAGRHLSSPTNRRSSLAILRLGSFFSFPLCFFFSSSSSPPSPPLTLLSLSILFLLLLLVGDFFQTSQKKKQDHYFPIPFSFSLFLSISLYIHLPLGIPLILFRGSLPTSKPLLCSFLHVCLV